MDVGLFSPELALILGIVGMLLIRLVRACDRVHLAAAALVVVGVAFTLACVQIVEARNSSDCAKTIPLFTGMLVSDPFSLYVRAVILLASLLTVALTILTGIPDREDSSDLYTLLLGATLGMMLMTEANHLLMVFIAVEMASLPSYAMAGFLKGRRGGSEAALKYVVFGAAASGVMLYGISLLAGMAGSGSLAVVLPHAAGHLQPGPNFDLATAVGVAFLFVGLAFKLAAVPFHFWCPDVFEGAAAEVAGFLSVASKAAAIALTARVLLMLKGPEAIGVVIGIVAAVTATLGNLAAFSQNNLKRMLAYSTIAHAGYMLLALATLRRDAAAAVLFYLAAYVLMNLGAFAVVAFVRNQTRSEDLDAFRGLSTRSPVLAVAFTVFLLSLLGLPPLAGFAGKFQVFASLWSASRDASHANLGIFYAALLGIGALNTAISAYYYLRVVRVMILEDATEDHTPPRPTTIGVAFYVVGLSLALLALGILWNPLTSLTAWAVS